uniref:DNA/RNA-binding protein Alba-like domain-containing protein n=1 Tax=Kalanchoe fedtschenkoi TaxID=63787 RepID=A0A7N0UE71_KALFE
MEKSEAIAVEKGGGDAGDVGRVEAIAVEKDGVTKMEKATTIPEKKDPIAADNNAVREKKEKEANKGGKKKAGAGDGQRKKKSSPKAVSGGDGGVVDQATLVVKTEGGAKECRLQVSNTKKPLFFYLKVAKRYIKQNNHVELSALGMAIPTVVTISEILKKDGRVTEKKIGTSTVTLKDEAKGRDIMKAKIEILLEKRKVASGVKGPSKIIETSESNGKLIEKKDQSETSGTLTEKKDKLNTNMKLTEGKESSVNNNGDLSVEKEACGGKVADKENTDVAPAVDGK